MPRGAPYGPRRKGELPPITVVEACVTTACLITHADPKDVLSGIYPAPRTGDNKKPEHLAISRARHYAAFALRAIYEDANWADMAAMLGARQPQQFYNVKDIAMRETSMHWWSDAAFMRVIEATEAFIEMKKKKEEHEASEKRSAEIELDIALDRMACEENKND